MKSIAVKLLPRALQVIPRQGLKDEVRCNPREKAPLIGEEGNRLKSVDDKWGQSTILCVKEHSSPLPKLQQVGFHKPIFQHLK